MGVRLRYHDEHVPRRDRRADVPAGWILLALVLVAVVVLTLAWFFQPSDEPTRIGGNITDGAASVALVGVPSDRTPIRHPFGGGTDRGRPVVSSSYEVPAQSPVVAVAGRVVGVAGVGRGDLVDTRPDR